MMRIFAIFAIFSAFLHQIPERHYDHDEEGDEGGREDGDDEELVGEAADLLFHLLVLLGEKDIALAQVLAELDRREDLSGLDEKASRSE